MLSRTAGAAFLVVWRFPRHCLSGCVIVGGGRGIAAGRCGSYTLCWSCRLPTTVHHCRLLCRHTTGIAAFAECSELCREQSKKTLNKEDFAESQTKKTLGKEKHSSKRLLCPEPRKKPGKGKTLSKKLFSKCIFLALSKDSLPSAFFGSRQKT